MKKFIRITKTGLELARVAVTRPVIVVGRSPGCDVVLRAPGVRPIHFILEWVGDGQFDPGSGSWSIIEFGPAPVQSRADVVSAATGEGVLLETIPVSFGGFRFEWGEDRLEATSLPGGHVLEKLVSEEEEGEAGLRASQNGGPHLVLESVIVRHDPGSVVDVDHRELRENVRLTLSVDPKIQVLRAGMRVQIFLDRSLRTQVFRRGDRVEPALKGDEGLFEMTPADVVQLRNADEDMLLRFVPFANVPAAPREIKGDGVLKWAALSVIFVASMSFALKKLPPLSKLQPEKPPRIVRVEIQESSRPAGPPPAPPAPPAPAPPVPEAMKANKAAPAPRAETKIVDTKAPPRSKKPARAADPMDLLSSLKQKPGARGNRVDVDDLVTSGAGPQAAVESGSGILVRQPPPGVRQSEFKNVSGAKGNLSRAASQIDVSESVQGESFEISEGDRQFRSNVDDRGLGDSAGSSDGEFRRDGAGATGSGDGIESIKGGLTRASVRKTLAGAREEIRGCYNKALLTNSKLQGMTIFRWYISPQGDVTTINLVKSDLGFRSLEDCVKLVIRNLKFDRAKNEIPTTVVYPFKFKKTG